LPDDWRRRCLLEGGDDYELLFTAAPGRRDAVLAAAELAATPVTRIGTVDAARGLCLHDGDLTLDASAFHGFDHFRV
jgi:thiamine-monophosphate kinase